MLRTDIGEYEGSVLRDTAGDVAVVKVEQGDRTDCERVDAFIASVVDAFVVSVLDEEGVDDTYCAFNVDFPFFGVDVEFEADEGSFLLRPAGN